MTNDYSDDHWSWIFSIGNWKYNKMYELCPHYWLTSNKQQPISNEQQAMTHRLSVVTTIHTLMYNTQKNSNAITQDIIYGKGHMDTNLVLCFWRIQLKLNLNLWLYPQHTEENTVTSWLLSQFKWGMKGCYLFTYLILLPVVALSFYNHWRPFKPGTTKQ